MLLIGTENDGFIVLINLCHDYIYTFFFTLFDFNYAIEITFFINLSFFDFTFNDFVVRGVYVIIKSSFYPLDLKWCITESEYDNYQQQFQDKINDIEARLALLKNAEDNYYTTAECVLRLAKHAHELFVGSEVEKKRQIVKLTLQNLRLEGKKVVYEAYEPFDLILKCNDRQRWCPLVDAFRKGKIELNLNLQLLRGVFNNLTIEPTAIGYSQ